MRGPNNYGSLLHELRLQRGITGYALARQIGMSQSKISKIENNAMRRVSKKDIQAILDALNAPAEVREAVFYQAKMTPPSLVYHYLTRSNWTTMSEKVYEEERATRHIRVYTHGIPLLLQTLDYTEAFRKKWDLAEDEITEIIKKQQRRKEILWDTERTFHFIIDQAALYSTWTGLDIQLKQLERLEQLSKMPHITFGIIPLTAGWPSSLVGGTFTLLDDRLVWVETAVIELEFIEANDVGEYGKLFIELAYSAAYQEQMREMIWNAVDYLQQSA